MVGLANKKDLEYMFCVPNALYILLCTHRKST